MTDKEMTARHDLKLDYVQQYLKEMNFHTNYEKKSDKLPFDTIFSAIKKEDDTDPMYINFSFIPVSSDFIYSLDLMQFFCFFDFDLKPDNKSMVIKLLDIINLKAMIGSFFVAEDKIVFKYVYMLPSYDVVKQENFKEAVLLFVYTYDVFYKIIKAVNSGEKSLGAALKEIP